MPRSNYRPNLSIYTTDFHIATLYWIYINPLITSSFDLLSICKKIPISLDGVKAPLLNQYCLSPKIKCFFFSIFAYVARFRNMIITF